jgi:LmbE family N-acetylglucosaminyl deacetylase
MSQPDFPERTTLVMAHPDDEALWATSVLSRMERIVFCFEVMASRPDWSEGRRRSLAEYPLPRVTQLGLQESEVFSGAAWPEPEETDYGLKVRRRPGARPGFSEKRYRENHRLLVEELRPILTGYEAVITHNPWGEYGHEEHVQVFRAVANLQAEMGFALWVPGYVSNKSYPLMLRHLSRLDGRVSCQPTDPELGARLKALYTENECWTWFDDYVWPVQECFHRWIGPGEQPAPPRSGSFVKMNMLWIKWEPLRRKSLLSRLLRRAGRLLVTASE